MIKVLKIILTVLVTSFFFFPFSFSFFPSQNTKNLLAVAGLVFVIIELVRRKDFSIPLELLILLFLSGMVSLLSLISITYNQTPDTTYVSFIRATAIWLSSAFAVIYIIRSVHGYIDVSLVAHYLIGVCVFQCIMAMLIAFVPAVQVFVDSHVMQGQEMLREMDRIYGIGAFLDIAGSRFACVLVSIAFLISSPKQISSKQSVLYTISFIVISIVGNMIARTTTVGMVLGIGWILLSPSCYSS